MALSFILFTSKVFHGIVKERLPEIRLNILEEILLVTLAMTHLAKDLAVTADKTLDGVVRAVRVVRRLHGRLTGKWVGVLEGHLTGIEQLGGKLLADHELTLAVAHWDSELIADVKARKPRGIGGGHPRGDHAGDMAVNVVAEEGRRVLGDLTQTAVREKAGLHEGLEAVADAEDEAATVEKVMDGLRDLGIVQNIGDKLAASIRLVTGREAAAEGEDLALGYVLFHPLDGVEDGLLCEVTEDTETGLGTCLAEGLGRVVVAVRARENWQVHKRMLDAWALVLKIYLLGLEWLNPLGSARKEFLEVRLAFDRINGGEGGLVRVH